MSKFNPTKPFGTIRGRCEKYPSARYLQMPYYYDIHRRCLNPEMKAPPEPDAIEDATKALINSAQKAADDALLRMQKAKAAVEEDPNPGKKAALTKASKAYDKAQAKLDKLMS